MNRVVIPSANWHMVLANAVKNADNETVVIVDSEAKKELAIRAAERCGKSVSVEIETGTSSLGGPYTTEELLSSVGRSQCPRCHESSGRFPCPNCGGCY